jgi:type VI secretion system protein ImpK
MPDIDDPFKPSDATILRPRPGAGRRGAADGSPVRLAPIGPNVRPIADDTRGALAVGLNPLAQAASAVLVLAGQIRGTLSPPDIAALRRYALDEIRRFENRARDSGIPQEVVISARYAVCATFDEAVLSTPWGAQSDWAQQPLLVALHREAWGGEKFFEMLDRLLEDPKRHIDLLELQYLCLAVGFAGKFQVLARGDSRLADIKQELYRVIRAERGGAPPELALRWRGVEDRRNRLIRYVPWWVVGAAVLAIMAMTFAIYYARLANAAAPIHAELAKVGLEGFTASAAPPTQGPTLKMLLSGEEASRTLSVEEQAGRTLITLLAPDLFASGSAIPNASYGGVLQRVADALNKVPGRVLVVGHTDDQPLNSLRYRNNFELSRERAVSVARMLQGRAANPARFEWTGVGSSEPRYRPESDPANRARNRRVEIIHVR